MGRLHSWVVIVFLVSVGLVSCASEEYPASLWQAQHPAPDAAADVVATAAPTAGCRQASAQPLPQRLVVKQSATDAGAPSETLTTVDDLWQLYRATCETSGCHGNSPPPGNFNIPSAAVFPSAMTPAVLKHVTSEGPTPGNLNPIGDPLYPMPPFGSGGMPYSQRLATQPNSEVVQLATLVQEWFDAGSPPTGFYATAPDGGALAAASASAATGAPASYHLPPSVGDTMTVVGNCIPSAAGFASEEAQSTALDAMFAQATPVAGAADVATAIGLPESLNQTDLLTFDSAVLARYGVVAYAPAYPLWSDNIEGGIETGKLRFVRVPRGMSIVFDKTTQRFSIPPNTRFYKTFMKRVIDTDGSYRYRKIETRLIVARPDTTDPQGVNHPHALFGTYVWNDDESDAKLDNILLANGQPFADKLFDYVKDAPLSPYIRAQNPGDPDLAEVSSGTRKHYAIPSSERCIECHEGSPTEDFILGFIPLQMNRRPTAEGGTIEATGVDELSQLQRMIDYGVVTGIDSVSDVLPLERAEGSRPPRNNYELTAQGYMIGNCEHCHNPRGFPSVQYPILAGVLDFLPGPGDNQGIFQFDLEKTSPRIYRGSLQTTKIPYITPSLMDLPEPKENTSKGITFQRNGNQYDYVLYAPWRSLIFRNTRTPFTYTDDFALFPHMPMNVPGFDVHASQIMADWMVSIPAVRKDPERDEYPPADHTRTPDYDTNEQPYVEVRPGSPGYEAAFAAAQKRVSILHTGYNPDFATEDDENGNTFSVLQFPFYSYSPDTSDIIDPRVEYSTCQVAPLPLQTTTSDLFGTDVGLTGIPSHAHWVVTDLTTARGDWSPRRSDWDTALIPGILASQGDGGATTGAAPSCQDTSLAAAAAKQVEENVAIDLLQDVKLDDAITNFAKTKIAFGLWERKPGCTFEGVPTAGSYTSGNRPRWMDNPAAGVTPDAPVLEELPGEAVFNMICINCHGPQADGTGRLADNLLTITGGKTRVANLRDGIFGPVGQMGANRQAVFSDTGLAALRPDVNRSAIPALIGSSWESASVDERAARYLAWMGLGGTQKNIPSGILNIVADTPVLGVHRSLPSSVISANMLSAAKALCQSVLFGNPTDSAMDRRTGDISGPGPAVPTPLVRYRLAVTGPWFAPDTSDRGEYKMYQSGNHDLITANGDAELWLRLCTLDNPPPVRVAVKDDTSKDDTSIDVMLQGDGANVGHLLSADVVKPEVYGPNPVGNDRGGIDDGGITPANLAPWCLMPAAPADDAGAGDAGAGPAPRPQCPPAVANAVVPRTAYTGHCGDGTDHCWSESDADRWATRGAINAGLAVFLYLRAITQEGVSPVPGYDQCQLLGNNRPSASAPGP